jgi:cytoskeleton protein RodZ
MDMKEMGRNLRLGREGLGLSVEDVVQRTKISKVNVLALEAGDAEALPHPVYAKGFVRNYAKLLGLDPDAYAEALSREFQVGDNVAPPQPEGAVAEPSPLDDGEGGRWKILVAGLVVLACIVGAVAYMYSGPKAGPVAEEAVSAPAPAAPPVAEEAPAAAPDEPVAVEAPEAQPEQAAPEAQPAPEAEPAEPAAEAAPAQAEPEAQAAMAAPEAETEGHAALADDGRHRVLIRAEEPCWILATVDGGGDGGGLLVDIMLQPGQSKLLHYAKSLVVKLGNAGGVRVTLDGEPFTFDAQSGQVRTLTFPGE